MRQRRASDARQRPGILAACLTAWSTGEEGIDSDVGALIVAETILLVRSALTKR